MPSLKNILLESLYESDNTFAYLSEDTLDSVEDVSFDKNKDSIVIEFKTTYGKTGKFKTKHSRFKHWLQSNIDKSEGNTYHAFLKDFISTSDQSEMDEEAMNEIIDDNNNIIGDDDQPNNATNTMVGSSKWDTDQVVRANKPRMTQMSGSMGYGSVVW